MASLGLVVIAVLTLWFETAATWETGMQVHSAYCIVRNDVVVCNVTSGEPADALASATYQDDVETLGYGRLHLKTVSSEPGLGPYAAGYLEGVLTANRVAQYMANAFTSASLWAPSPHLMDFVEKSDAHWGELVKHRDPKDEYLRTVQFVRDQFAGLVAGVNKGLGPGREVTRLQMFMLNGLSDMDDIKSAVNASERVNFDLMKDEDLRNWAREHGHCSAVIKLLPDGSELFTGHNTWQNYHLMLPMWKRYEFGSRTPISMSSYPGFLSSTDDYYQVGNLVIIETTLPNYNNDLFDLVKPQALPFWIRAMTANQLAKSGHEWMDIFRRQNGGTYNCMWMVVDYNKFVPGESLQPWLLTVGEQLPEYFHYEDQTQTLSYGYWPSYNAALYGETAKRIKQDVMTEEKGNGFSYQMVARAEIFRRDQGFINDDVSMQRLLRYNRFQVDPLAAGDSCSQPACRSDLAANASARKAFGATDAKYTSSTLVRKGQTVVVYGPTHDDQPVFDWRNVPDLAAVTPHEGQPRRFNFQWMLIGADMSMVPYWKNLVPESLIVFVVGMAMFVGIALVVAQRRFHDRQCFKDVLVNIDSGYKPLEGSPASSVSTSVPPHPCGGSPRAPTCSPSTDAAPSPKQYT